VRTLSQGPHGSKFTRWDDTGALKDSATEMKPGVFIPSSKSNAVAGSEKKANPIREEEPGEAVTEHATNIQQDSDALTVTTRLAE